MEFFRQFGLLFSNMEWYIIVCLIVGLALLIIEIFQPGFGVFGITGSVLLIASIILRAIVHQSEDNVPLQIFQLILLIIIIAGSSFGFFVYGTKKKWFKKNDLFTHYSTAVDVNYSDGTQNFGNLVGKKGVAATDLRPSGKVIIDGTTYDVVAHNFFIEKDSNVVVSSVEGIKIEVSLEK